MREKLPISLCMIVKDEEKYLDDCLKSVSDIVNEMIIVDTGSQDKTVEIAERHGAKVYHYTWQNDFAAARNEALKYATNPWILQLDADEELIPETAGWFYDQYPWLEHDGYYVTLQNIKDEGSDEIMLAHKLIRFYKNHPENYYQFSIHENMKVGSGKTGESTVELLHKGYGSEINNERKVERNKQALLEKLEENPADPFTHYYLAQCYEFLNDSEKAIEACKQGLSLGLPYPVKSHTYRILFSRYFDLRRYDSMEAVMDTIPDVEVFPEVLFYKALVANSKSRINEAIRFYEEFLTFVQQENHREDIGKETFVLSSTLGSAYGNLGSLYLKTGELSKAKETWKVGLYWSPTTLQLYGQMAKIFIKESDFKSAKYILQEAISVLEKQQTKLGQKKVLPEYRLMIEKIEAVERQAKGE